jgi:hypothetical protein
MAPPAAGCDALESHVTAMVGAKSPDALHESSPDEPELLLELPAASGEPLPWLAGSLAPLQARRAAAERSREARKGLISRGIRHSRRAIPRWRPCDNVWRAGLQPAPQASRPLSRAECVPSTEGSVPSRTKRGPSSQGRARSRMGRRLSTKGSAASGTERGSSTQGSARSRMKRDPASQGSALSRMGRGPSSTGRAPSSRQRDPAARGGAIDTVPVDFSLRDGESAVGVCIPV